MIKLQQLVFLSKFKNNICLCLFPATERVLLQLANQKSKDLNKGPLLLQDLETGIKHKPNIKVRASQM